MKRFLKHYRLSENIEVLFMLTLGIILQTTDGSPFSIWKRWTTVWDTELPPEQFSQLVQKCIKMILSSIVVGRCLTTYLYVVSAMLVMFSIIKDSLPSLMLFWLLIAGTKSLFLTFIEALTGVYVCSAFGKVRKACVEFFISKALEIIFAAYLWGSVLSIYEEMVRKEAKKNEQEKWTETRPRARSLLDESTLYKTARLNSFEFKDVPQIILQMLRREEEMSQDSLLGPGMMLASVSNFGSFADLKTSQSLGELGLLDMKGIRVMGLEEDDLMLPQERALKFLKMNWNDVRKIQETRKSLDREVFVIDEETWNRVESDRGNPKRPKQARPEIVLQGIPRLDLEQEVELSPKSKRRNTIDLEFGFSLFSFIREKDELHTRDEEQISSTETLEEDVDEEDEEGSPPLFMSNIREEVTVNRIRLDFVSKKIKGNAYEKLYKEEYMSVIGPEVFDRATKLPKVTSLVISKPDARTSMSLPVLAEVDKKNRKKINFDLTLEEKWKTLTDSFFSLDQEVLDEKQNEIDYTSEFMSSSHSLDDDFYPPETVLSQENKTMDLLNETNEYEGQRSDVEEKENEELKTLASEKVEKCSADETQTDDEKVSTTCSNIEKSFEAFESSESKSLVKVLPSSHRENGCEERAETSTKPGENKYYYRTKIIKIKRVGRRLQKNQSNPTMSKGGPDRRKDDCNDGSSDSGNQTNSSACCEEETATLDGRRSVRLRKLRNFFCDGGESKSGGGGGGGGGGCSDEDKRKSQTSLPDKPRRRQINDSSLAAHFGLADKRLRRTKCPGYFESVKRPKVERDSGTKIQEREKIWKSKVLKEAAIFNPVIDDKRESFHDFYASYYADLMNTLWTNKVFRTWKRSTKETETEMKLNASGSDEILISKKDKKGSSINIFYDRFHKNPTNDTFLEKDGVQENSSQSLSLSGSCASLAYSEKEANDCQSGSKSTETTSATDDDSTSRKNEMKITDGEPQQEDSIDSISKSGTPPVPDTFAKPDDFTSDENILLWDRKLSEETFSLYYSKAADLASSLLDMKRFIYPDHIHYSYKHVKKKGFDVNINNGLPLTVRESLTMNESTGVRHASVAQNPELKIIRRPMDLSFASTNNWRSFYLSDSEIEPPETQRIRGIKEVKWLEPSKDKKGKKSKRKGKKGPRPRDDCDAGDEPKADDDRKNPKDSSKGFRGSENDDLLMERLLKLCKRLNKENWVRLSESKETNEKDHPPLQISSTQLHSNKGRTITANYIPALVLNENKTRNEKRKMETLEERTKDMFARLKREILFQNNNYQKNFKPPNNY